MYDEMIGLKFARLVVIERDSKPRGRHYLCRCDCGKEVVVLGANLRSGGRKSCGCLRRDNARSLVRRNRENRSFSDMLEASREFAMAKYGVCEKFFSLF